MDKLIFYVQGSSREPYKVTFWKENSKLRCGCNCTASINGSNCKHKVNLVVGDVTNIVEKEDSSSISDLENLLQGEEIVNLCKIFLEASVGEKIKKFSNSYKRLEALYDKASSLEPVKFEEIPVDIFENNLLYKDGRTNIIYTLDEEPIYVFFADKRKIAPLDLTELRPKIFTKSQYFIKCYETFRQTNMPVLREDLTKALR